MRAMRESAEHRPVALRDGGKEGTVAWSCSRVRAMSRGATIRAETEPPTTPAPTISPNVLHEKEEDEGEREEAAADAEVEGPVGDDCASSGLRYELCTVPCC